MEITRYILPVVSGAMIGILVIVLGENIVHSIYPYPPGTDLSNPESIRLAIKLMPAKLLIMVLVNFAIASFIAGFVASIASKRITAMPALVVGLVLTLSGMYNALFLPHPLWFTLANLVVYLPFSYLAYLLIRKKDLTPVS